MARFVVDGTTHAVTPLPSGAIMVDDVRHAADVRRLAREERVVLLDGKPHRMLIARDGDVLHVHLRGRTHSVRRLADAAQAAAEGAADDQVRAPMPGTVIRVAAQPGAAVRRGETLLVIESMKVETAITAPRDGIVASIGAAEGATFDRGALLAALAPVG
jgi:biotin carboxyl carrier protein